MFLELVMPILDLTKLLYKTNYATWYIVTSFNPWLNMFYQLSCKYEIVYFAFIY
jgi:hypothetical protein